MSRQNKDFIHDDEEGDDDDGDDNETGDDDDDDDDDGNIECTLGTIETTCARQITGMGPHRE